MDPALPKAVLDAADISAIAQLVVLERESRDCGRWQRMRECFHADSVVNLSWFNGSGHEFVSASIDMARRDVLARHRLGPVLVRLAGDRAVASFSGAIDIPGQLDGVHVQLSSHARFLYGVERREGAWKIVSFDAVYLRDELRATIPGQAVRVDPSEVQGFRPSYRLLTLLLSRAGYRVNGELAGDDRPSTVQALEARLYGWLGVEP